MRDFQDLRNLIRDDRGATAIEYGLIAALICLAIMGALGSVADETNEMWTFVRGETEKAMDNE